MKKVNVAFSLALLLMSGYYGATPVAAKSSVHQQTVALANVGGYADGYADGQAYAADLAAVYGAGTPEYTEAIAAEKAIAVRRAREVSTDPLWPLYWRGYAAGLG
jgi:hypothetical protein